MGEFQNTANEADGEKDTRPWWKRMKRETGKIKTPFGDEIKGARWSVKGDGFLYEIIEAVKGWFR